MIKEKMQKALNKQLNEELFSSYAYLAMSAYFEAENLIGFASWMKIQSQEEYAHAMKIFEYMHQAGGKVVLQKIDVPRLTWKTSLEVFQDMLKQELSVTKSIDDLVDLAIAEKDHATNNFLQWFVSEQVEEEASSIKFLERMKLIGDNKNGLFLLDREMGMRARG
ncbi:MAG: ferritin [Ignavibacteriaceae bacterium]